MARLCVTAMEQRLIFTPGDSINRFLRDIIVTIISAEESERGENTMDIERTKAYYEQIKEDSLCTCIYCQNYYRQIRGAYPALSEYLSHLGVDIEKSYYPMPCDPDKTGMIKYVAGLYIIFGTPDGFEKTTIGSVHVNTTEIYPPTEIEEDHFVVEVSPIFLKWIM